MLKIFLAIPIIFPELTIYILSKQFLHFFQLYKNIFLTFCGKIVEILTEILNLMTIEICQKQFDWADSQRIWKLFYFTAKKLKRIHHDLFLKIFMVYKWCFFDWIQIETYKFVHFLLRNWHFKMNLKCLKNFKCQYFSQEK